MGPYANPTIAEQSGIVTFEDIIPGVTVSEQFDELTGTSKLVVNEYIPAGYKPTVLLATASNEIIRYVLDPKASLNIQEGKKVEIADIIAKHQKQLKNQKILLEVFLEYLSYLKLDDQKILQF